MLRDSQLMMLEENVVRITGPLNETRTINPPLASRLWELCFLKKGNTGNSTFRDFKYNIMKIYSFLTWTELCYIQNCKPVVMKQKREKKKRSEECTRHMNSQLTTKEKSTTLNSYTYEGILSKIISSVSTI